jgi:SAM-dependent methyltransferase
MLTPDTRRAPIPADAANYERHGVPRGVPFLAPLLALAPPPAHGSVLDLACGTGVVARAVAPRLGAAGRVFGVDWSAAMVTAAHTRAAEEKLTRCRFAVMDAHALALGDAAFDAVYCQFGLMLLREPARAAAEIARVLRPGGCVAAAVWSEPAQVAGFSAYLAAAHAQVPGARPPEVHPVFTLAAPGALARLLTGAGLTVQRDERVAVRDHHADATAYWTWASEIVGFPVDTSAGRVTPRIVDYPPALQAAVRADALTRLRPYELLDGRLALPSAAVLVRATRPSSPRA